MSFQSQPTVYPYSNFNAAEDGQTLRGAMKGLGTDEETIIDILCARTNNQRQQIAKYFNEEYDRDIIEDLKSELGGHFEDVIVALMLPPEQYLCKQLHRAMKGAGTDEKALIEILCSRDNDEMQKIVETYESMYDRPLAEHMCSETEGDLRRLLTLIITGTRDESTNVNADKAREQAEELFNAGEAKFGTDEAIFTKILAHENFNQLRRIFEEYKEIAGNTIEQALKGELDGELLEATLAIVECVQSPPAYFAIRLHEAMAGGGTDDVTLIRIIVSRSEIDLGSVKNEYERIYNKTLESKIRVFLFGMMYKLVRYVEDLIWHVCHNSNVRISNENHLVHAKYQGYFYPALIINEGTKEQMNALKNRYEHHDSILKKYFKFTPVDHIGLKNASTQTFDMRKEFTESTTQTDDISEESKRKCLDNIDVGNAEVVDMQVTEAKIHHAAISAPNQTACAGCKGDDRNSDVGNMSFLSQTIVNEELNIHKDYELSDFSPEQSDEEYKLSVDSCSSTSTDIDDISEIDVSFSEGDKNYDRSEIGSVDGTLLSHCDNVVREAQNNDITDEISSNISLGNNFVDSSKSLASPNVVSYAKNQHFCIYCKTKVDKFARHLETKHKFESRVKEYLKFPKGDAKRRAIIANIRSLGTFMYNTDSEFNKGDILVARRTKCSERRRVEDYVPCPKCKNFFRKTLLYRHYRRCGCTVSRTYIKSAPRNLQNLSRATLYEGTIQFSKLQKYILPGMIHDDITRIIHRDKLILIYGNYLSQKYDGETHLVNMIRQKLRQVGQLLQTIRRLESTVTDLISVIRPSLFNKFVEAVRICAGYNEADGSFRAPSLISAIGQTVKECAEKLVIEYIIMITCKEDMRLKRGCVCIQVNFLFYAKEQTLSYFEESGINHDFYH